MQHSTEHNDIVLTLDELTHACGQQRQWVVALIEENIITPDIAVSPRDPNDGQFSGYQLTVLRRAARISRDFDASAPAVGLILDLLQEIDGLRQLKRQWHLDQPSTVEMDEQRSTV